MRADSLCRMGKLLEILKNLRKKIVFFPLELGFSHPSPFSYTRPLRRKKLQIESWKSRVFSFFNSDETPRLDLKPLTDVSRAAVLICMYSKL